MSESNYWTRLHRKRLSRRSMLGASAKVGVGAAGLALVGCGDDDDDDDVQAVAQVTPAAPEQQAEQVAQQAEPEEEQAAPVEQAEPAEEEQVVSAVKRGGNYQAPLVGLSTGNPPTLDPYEVITFLAAIPASFSYSQLLRFASGPDIDYLDFATVVPDAVESLPEIVDAQTHVYTLRDNLFFHDIEPTNGRAVTTEDVVLNDARFREISGNAANWITAVKDIVPTDDKTFTMNLNIPFAPMLNLAASPEHLRLIPQEIVDDGTVAQRLVGSGPWIFESFTPDVEILWRRNPNWYREGFPIMDEVRAAIVGDPSTIIANLASGTFDGSLLSSTIFNTVKDQVPELVFKHGGDNVFGGIYFNYATPPWGDVRARQAFSMAMDRPGIIGALDETGTGGAHSAIAQLAPFWLDPLADGAEFGPNIKYFQNDLQAANQLLDAAGFGDGISLRAISSPVYGPGFGKHIDLVLSTVFDGGFRAELENVEYGTYITTIFSGNFPEDSSGIAIAPLKVAVEPDDNLFAVYHPTSGRHNYGEGPGDISGNQALLDKFDAQRSEQDFDTRVELLKDIQREMAEFMYIVPWLPPSALASKQPYMRDMHIRGGFGVGTTYHPFMWKDV